MSTIRYTKAGLLIPAAWVKRWGKQAAVQRSADIVILESPTRRAVRRRLTRVVRTLRARHADSPPVTSRAIARLVTAVRRKHARRH